MGDDERRGSRRFRLTLPLVVKYPELRGTAETLAHTRDVSFRGLSFTIDREFQIGSAVEFVLTLPKEVTLSGDVRLRCSGRVVRVEAPPESGQWGVAAEVDTYEFLPAENC